MTSPAAALASLGRALARAPASVLIALVRGYRFFLSPWLGSACRFEPTCSAYALQALQRHGAAAGSYLTLHRLARCGPWCDGGHDPVPERAPRLFAMLADTAERAPSSIQPTDKTFP
jgi:putative membrane protein insertion efficiency factor